MVKDNEEKNKYLDVILNNAKFEEEDNINSLKVV